MSEEFRVILSVGHGKRWVDGRLEDWEGAENHRVSLTEHKICAKIARVLYAMLEPDRRFFVSELPVGSLPLRERIQLANEQHGIAPYNLAVELHLNAFHQQGPDYCEVYHWHTSNKGQAYGDAFLEAMADALGMDDRRRDGVSEPFGDETWEESRAGWVKGTDMPALIVEPWFISNDSRATEAIVGGLVPATAWACYRGLVACTEVVE